MISLNKTYHCEQSAPHLVHPDVRAIAAEAVDHNLSWQTRIEALLRPLKSIRYVTKRDLRRLGAASSPVTAEGV